MNDKGPVIGQLQDVKKKSGRQHSGCWVETREEAWLNSRLHKVIDDLLMHEDPATVCTTYCIELDPSKLRRSNRSRPKGPNTDVGSIGIRISETATRQNLESIVDEMAWHWNTQYALRVSPDLANSGAKICLHLRSVGVGVQNFKGLV
jgi:hypothetical protein